MEGAIAAVLGTVTRRREEDTDGKRLLAEIDSVKSSLEMAAERFEYQSDPDLVDACIYEMQALTARYRYLTREARRQGITKSSLSCLKQLD